MLTQFRFSDTWQDIIQIMKPADFYQITLLSLTTASIILDNQWAVPSTEVLSHKPASMCTELYICTYICYHVLLPCSLSNTQFNSFSCQSSYHFSIATLLYYLLTLYPTHYDNTSHHHPHLTIHYSHNCQ